MEEEAAVEEEVAVEEVVEARQQAEQQLQEEEGTQNSSEQNHLPSAEIDKTSTDSSQISKDTCP